MNKMFFKSVCKSNMNKTICENLQNIDRNKTGKFSADFWLKINFKNMFYTVPDILDQKLWIK